MFSSCFLQKNKLQMISTIRSVHRVVQAQIILYSINEVSKFRGLNRFCVPLENNYSQLVPKRERVDLIQMKTLLVPA